MVGVDEVGRGCLAGPLLVVAARASSKLPVDVKDSKLLTRGQRERMIVGLRSICEFGEGWVSPEEIDRFGLGQCLKIGADRALDALQARIDEEIILDGKQNYLPDKYRAARTLVDADRLIPLVSAASIYAKVTRDHFMYRLAAEHPNFSFDQHVGYGTPRHQAEIEANGPVQLVHRFSFAPIRQTKLL